MEQAAANYGKGTNGMIEPILATYFIRILIRICGALKIGDALTRQRVAGQIEADLKNDLKRYADLNKSSEANCLAHSQSKSDN